MRLTMPALVQKDAEAMWGTITAFSHWSSPGFISGSSSKTSRPALQHMICNAVTRGQAVALTAEHR